MTNYRKPFVAAAALNIALGGGLALLWWRWHPKPSRADSAPESKTLPASGGGETGGNGTTKQPPAPAENPPVPVQLTPQPPQSNCVPTGGVEGKPVAGEIRTVRNGRGGETPLAYVQGRFPGWIA